MFNFGSTTPSSTGFLAQSTPINQTRSASGFLFNSTATQPSTLTSTPFGSTTLFGGATPGAATTTVISTGTGTLQKFDPVAGTDKINKNGIQTQIRTKIFNICAMAVYEKKSMEELRLEDYIDNRKFASATTTGTSLFPSTATNTSLFGGSTTLTNPTTSASNIFGATPASTTTTSTLFGNKPAVTTAAASPFTFGASTAATTTATTSPFTFGAPTTTTTATTTPFTFGAPTTSTTNPVAPFGGTTPAPAAGTSLFSFGSSQPQATATTATPAFSFGGGSTTTSLFPAASTATTGTTFGFSTSKPATVPTFSFPSSTTVPTAAPTLFSATAPNPTPILTTQSSVDTRTHLQLFQTMLNIQPFNSELGFLARNIKPNIGLDRTRLRTAPDSTTINPITNVFSPLLTKPSVLPSTTTTPPSSLINSLPTHPHTVPTAVLPLSTAKTSLGLFGKRKLADSFLDDDDDNSLMMDDGPSSIHKLSKVNAIKRPRVLDMNKIRSIVLSGVGSGGSGHNESLVKDENLSDTFVVKTTSENVSGWKKFATYDAYLASKKPQILEQPQRQEEKPTIDQERAFRLPQLTHDDYYTKPTIDELKNYFDEHGQCLVKEFTVGREHYGSVTFHGSKINLAGLDLNQLIEIGRRQVTVYPDDKNKPKEGEEFNCPAVISLLGVYPIDRSISNLGDEVTDPERLIDMNYGNYLREMTKKFQGKFIDYDVYTGTWTFQVDHF